MNHNIRLEIRMESTVPWVAWRAGCISEQKLSSVRMKREEMNVGCVRSQLVVQHYLFLASPSLSAARGRSAWADWSIGNDPSNISSEDRISENLHSQMESISLQKVPISMFINRFSGDSQLCFFFWRSEESIFRTCTPTCSLRHTRKYKYADT